MCYDLLRFCLCSSDLCRLIASNGVPVNSVPPKSRLQHPRLRVIIGTCCCEAQSLLATHTQNPPKLRELISYWLTRPAPTTVGTLPGAPSFDFLPKIAQLCSHYLVLPTNYLTINQISSEYRRVSTDGDSLWCRGVECDT